MLFVRLRHLGPSGFATGGLAAVLAVIGLLATHQMDVSQQLRETILQRRIALEDAGSLGIAMRDAESGQRGFMLTGDDSYLAPYIAALSRIPVLMQTLARETAVDARPHALMDALTPLVRQKLDELARTIRLRQETGESAALQVVKTSLGRHLMIGVAAALDAMVKLDATEIAKGRAAMQRSDRMVAMLSTGGLAIGALTLLLASLMLRTSLVRQRAADRQRRARKMRRMPWPWSCRRVSTI